MKPLHPLSAYALAELVSIAACPEPYGNVNPGVADRLLRGALVEVVDLPSPFRTHNGRAIRHLRITNAGRALLAGEGT